MTHHAEVVVRIARPNAAGILLKDDVEHPMDTYQRIDLAWSTNLV